MKKRRYLKKGIAAVTAALLAGSMLAGCAGSGSEDRKEAPKAEPQAKASQAVLMIQTEPDSFDPFLSAAAETWSVLLNIYDGLVYLGDDGTMQPDLAESYEISEDQKVYTFHIRDNAVFSNGQPVTINDVAASYRKYAEMKAGFEGVQSVEGEGNTLTITLAEPDASFLSLLNYGVAPADESLDLNITPIGSGPYRVAEYITGSQVVLEKNPYYATNPDRVPNLDKIIVKVNMSDLSVALNQLLAGDLDLTQYMDPANAEMVKQRGLQVIAAPSNTVQILAFNEEEAPFDDVRVRQAINYAIDKNAIIDTVFYGQGAPLYSHMSPVMAVYYTEDLEHTYSLDQEKAKALLKEAGYEDDLSFTIKVPSNYSRHVDTALMVQNMLKEVGVTANIEQIEWATWLDDVYTNRKFQATMVGMGGKVDPDKVLNRYESSYSRNIYNYKNPEYDALIAAGKMESDPEKRAEIYRQCQQYLVDDAVCVYTVDTPDMKYANAKLGGIKNYPAFFINMSSLYWME